MSRTLMINKALGIFKIFVKFLNKNPNSFSFSTVISLTIISTLFWPINLGIEPIRLALHHHWQVEPLTVYEDWTEGMWRHP